MTTLTLAIIAKHSPGTFHALVDAALPYVSQTLVAVDDDADPYIEGYHSDYVRYFRRALAKDFSAQRNFLIAQSTSDWVLHLDTDENLSPWLWDRLGCICDTVSDDVILLPRINTYAEKPGERIGWPDWQPKLHRRNGVVFQFPVHEWLTNYRTARKLPEEDRYAIIHAKTYAQQARANALYETIQPVKPTSV